MGTRGAVGFRIGGADKVAYNHFDSYPSGLGSEVITFIRDNNDDELKDLAAKIQFIDPKIPPTEEQKEMCRQAGTIDLSVNVKSEDDWYCLLRRTQGNLESWKKVPLIDDSHVFLVDSLFCEYAYIMNIDTDRLEVYRGFNCNDETNIKLSHGRYADLCSDERERYYGVVLVAEIPFDYIRKMTEEELLALMDEQIQKSTGMIFTATPDGMDEKYDAALQKSFFPWGSESVELMMDKALDNLIDQSTECKE